MSLRSREAIPEEHDEYLMMTWKRWGVNCWTVEASVNKLWETEIVKQDKAKEDGHFVLCLSVSFLWVWYLSNLKHLEGLSCGLVELQNELVRICCGVMWRSRWPNKTHFWSALQFNDGNYYLCHPSMWKYQEITLTGTCVQVCVDLVYFCILFHTELRFVFDDLVHATKSRSNMGKSISLIAK